MNIQIQLTDHPKEKITDASKLSFGKHFTDHMFTMKYENGKGWYDAKIEPYASIQTVSLLHGAALWPSYL